MTATPKDRGPQVSEIRDLEPGDTVTWMDAEGEVHDSVLVSMKAGGAWVARDPETDEGHWVPAKAPVITIERAD